MRPIFRWLAANPRGVIQMEYYIADGGNRHRYFCVSAILDSKILFSGKGKTGEEALADLGLDYWAKT